MNLFSVFDPATSSSFSLNWLSSFMVMLCLPLSFWVSKSQSLIFLKKISLLVHSEFKSITGDSINPGSTLIVVSMFFFLGLTNSLGLLPFIFTPSSHIVYTVALALPLWLGHMVFAWVKTPNNCLAHLVPTGTPVVLMPFMVLIELISMIIRPLTLSIRLAANMVAGHLLLVLLAEAGPSSGYVLLSLLLVSLLVLCVLESAVALIQAYVFSVLSTLYFKEVDCKKFNNLEI